MTNLSEDYSLLAPGPVNLHPEVRRILAEPMIHHRTPEFDEILARVLPSLKKIFETTQPVYILSSTGSGGMEALIVNTLSPGDQVLVLNCGKFGERWIQIAKAFSLDVIEIKVPWGQSAKPEEVKQQLLSNREIKAVLCQACETSTGVKNPIQEIGKIVADFPDCLFLVDGITALGAYRLPMDAYGIDGIVGGSQKAFMLPTGLSFVSFSMKAWRRIPEVRGPRFYFDIRNEDKANKNGETFFSSNVCLIKALDFVLLEILKIGLTKHYHSIFRRAEVTRLFFPRLSLNLYSPEAPSDSVTALIVPESFDSQKIRTHLEKKYDITIMGGQDQAKGKIIRIGHMGYIKDSEMIRLFSSLAKALNELSVTPFLTEDQISTNILAMKKWLAENP